MATNPFASQSQLMNAIKEEEELAPKYEPPNDIPVEKIAELAKPPQKLTLIKSIPKLKNDLAFNSIVTFQSSTSFIWCTPNCTNTETEIMDAFTSSRASSNNCITFNKLLLSWCNNSECSPSHLASLASSALKTKQKLGLTDLETLELSIRRRNVQDWKCSFKSLYYSYRNSRTSIFLYRNSMFDVIFGAGVAKIINSSLGVRRKLKDEDIEFLVVGDEVIDYVAEKKSRDPMDEDYVSGEEDVIADIVLKNKTSSLEIRAGNIHALYDWLLNWEDPKVAQPLPSLFSMDSFLGCKMAQVSVAKNCKFTACVSDTLRDGFKLDLIGSMFPAQFEAIVEVLEKNHPDLDYSVVK